MNGPDNKEIYRMLVDMLLKEQKEAIESDTERKAKREKFRLENIKLIENLRRLIRFQCTHLKGTMRGKATTQVPGHLNRGVLQLFWPEPDYAISDHTFIDHRRVVKCMLCGKTWEGEELNSPEVEYMLEHTTNTKTASEESWKMEQSDGIGSGSLSESNRTTAARTDGESSSS